MQNVGTPRFYVSWGDYFKALGYNIDPINLLNPSHQMYDDTMKAADNDYYEIFGDEVDGVFTDRSSMAANINKGANFWFCLGHNFSGYNIICKRYQYDNEEGDSQEHEDDMGTTSASVNYPTEYDGWSMRVGDDDGWGEDFNPDIIEEIHTGFQTLDDVPTTSDVTRQFSCMVYGRKYDIPYSPDLNLKLSYEYDGVKTIQTKSGATLSNAMYTKPADWGILNTGQYTNHPLHIGAWQLGGYGNIRTGRRTWDLSFSYLADTDVFPVNASQSYAAYSSNGYHTTTDNPTTGDIDINTLSEDGGTAGQFQSNILGGEDFFSQVWNKTLGNTLPFIFNPNGGGDSPNNSPDQFAICKFVGNTLQYEQVAHNTYNIKLKIEEVW